MSNRDSILSSSLRSPARMLAIILVMIFCTEVSVMLLLPNIIPDVLGGTGEAFVDAILLTLVCAPVLWIVILAAKKSEQERINMARETEALRAQQMTTLAQLATGVAHEIRNPLTSIKMLIQVNQTKFSDEGLPTDDLKLVEHEIRRMERSVNSLLEYARPERSEFSRVNLQEVIRNIVQLIEARCDSQSVELTVLVPTSVAAINGDAAQIQQLLLNLTLNALDAMPEGGTLTIALNERVKKDADTDYEIRIQDTGCGISEAVAEKLFSPFVTTKENGVGLGLGICRRIAQAHHGSLDGFNRPAKGAEFLLTLPQGWNSSATINAADRITKDNDRKVESTCKAS